MHRPLNWVAVCLLLLLLIATLSFDRKPASGVQSGSPALVESVYADNLRIDHKEPQFGYVRADGSFLPLEKQDDAPVLAEAGAAVYVWSSPVSDSKVLASF